MISQKASSSSSSDPEPSLPGGAPGPRPRANFVLAMLLALAAAGGGVRYLLTSGLESTDDAQVEGRIVTVSPRVAGQVTRVLVRDNQLVHAGEVVVELDRADLEMKWEAARADVLGQEAELAVARARSALISSTVSATLRQARGGVLQASTGTLSAKATLDASQADVAAAEARFKLAEAELGRTRQLISQGALSPAEGDARQEGYAHARAAMEQTWARLAAAKAGVEGSLGAMEAALAQQAAAQTGPAQMQAAEAAMKLAEARLQQAKAIASLAELAVSYTQVRAPVTGQVSRRSVEIGQMVGPERPLMAIVPQDDLWVVANFKENQVGRMRPGQPVELTVDAFPGLRFKGHVDSLAGASGARFALLPPDNASGNFVKVVQRIPVLVRFDERAGDLPLKPGMSVEATVDTRGR